MSKIEEAIEDVINGHLSGMDFTDMITSEVRDCWDMDELDRVDDMNDRLENVESWIVDAEDKLSIQNVIDLENSVKNLIDHVNELQDRVNVLQSLQLERKSFLSRLLFWR